LAALNQFARLRQGRLQWVLPAINRRGIMVTQLGSQHEPLIAANFC